MVELCTCRMNEVKPMFYVLAVCVLCELNTLSARSWQNAGFRVNQCRRYYSEESSIDDSSAVN